jgi:hypothetical protein
MTRYPRLSLEARLHASAIESAHRIYGLTDLREPLKIRPSPSRFCDGTSGYAVLYAAVSFETCVVETLVRDRFAWRARRELPLAAILMRACAHMATKPGQKLNLRDLRGSGCLEIGAPTDAVRARHLAAGQALARAVYEEHPDVDGVVYSSRLTGEDCLAVFDRAVENLVVLKIWELKDHPVDVQRRRMFDRGLGARFKTLGEGGDKEVGDAMERSVWG